MSEHVVNASLLLVKREMDNMSVESSRKDRQIDERPRGGLPLPLNSKRQMAGHLKRIVKALGLPTTAVGDEIQQMIEGKLLGDGRELWNMQVIFDVGTPGVAFVLQDEEAEFLTVEEEVEEPLEPSVTGSQHEGEEMETLQQEVEAVRIESKELQQQLSREKDRFRELWRTNCRCLAEYDNMLVKKDTEIEQLKQRLAEVGYVSSSEDHHGAELLRSDSNPH